MGWPFKGIETRLEVLDRDLKLMRESMASLLAAFGLIADTLTAIKEGVNTLDFVVPPLDLSPVINSLSVLSYDIQHLIPPVIPAPDMSVLVAGLTTLNATTQQGFQGLVQLLSQPH